MNNKRYKNSIVAKRFLDIVLSVLILPLFFLILIIVSAHQFWSIGVFYIQPRIGMNGKIFKIYKFKTMKDGDDKMVLNKKGVVKIQDDVRITKFGQILRVYSLDEIPQIINILKGEMSWVGPRPIVKLEFDNLNNIEKNRTKVKPGITGLAQITGRDALDIKKLTQYDLNYIENYSFILDLQILLKSIKVVTKKENCY